MKESSRDAAERMEEVTWEKQPFTWCLPLFDHGTWSPHHNAVPLSHHIIYHLPHNYCITYLLHFKSLTIQTLF